MCKLDVHYVLMFVDLCDTSGVHGVYTGALLLYTTFTYLYTVLIIEIRIRNLKPSYIAARKN